MSTHAAVTVNIAAGPIKSTGYVSDTVGHQISMGDDLFIHIEADTAKQWVAVLETITKEGK